MNLDNHDDHEGPSPIEAEQYRLRLDVIVWRQDSAAPEQITWSEHGTFGCHDHPGDIADALEEKALDNIESILAVQIERVARRTLSPWDDDSADSANELRNEVRGWTTFEGGTQ